jgi:hypothetical protein
MARDLADYHEFQASDAAIGVHQAICQPRERFCARGHNLLAGAFCGDM